VGKAKVTVSIDEGLLGRLDEIGKQQKSPRSRLVEQAIRLLWSELLEEQLRQGYQAMAMEDRDTAEQLLPTGVEALR
jgi:metal-responsive CopG/Arc/MetJ family transcriptional regulator